MSVTRRSILPPYVGDPGHAPDQAAQIDPTTGMRITNAALDIPDPPQPSVSNEAMGETGVDSNTAARHQDLVSSHQAASAREAGRGAAADNHSGAGMVIGSQGPLVLGGGDGGHGDHDSDAPNQGNPAKAIAGTDGFSTGGDGDSGPQTGAGKVLG